MQQYYRYLIIQLSLLSFSTVSDLNHKVMCYDKLTIGFLSKAVTVALSLHFAAWSGLPHVISDDVGIAI